MDLWSHLSSQISEQTQRPFQVLSHTALSGGCISQAFKVTDGHTEYFVKTNDLSHGDMFKTEAVALHAISETHTVRVPAPICYGQSDTQSYLVLEFLNLSGQLNSRQLGQQLAALHQITAAQFGWQQSNTIGSTPQLNKPHDNWIDFWRSQRLIPQIQLAEKNGFGRELSPLMDKLVCDFGHLFSTYSPQPSMLHGDLWGGNCAALQDTTPVIYDPAFYYGDRETDIAMTSLFGGFDTSFYAAYQQTWPLDEGFSLRKTFYNLYHILNHLNLFGGGYLNQCISMSQRILAEI